MALFFAHKTSGGHGIYGMHVVSHSCINAITDDQRWDFLYMFIVNFVG